MATKETACIHLSGSVGEGLPRDRWQRKADWVELQLSQIAELLRPVTGDRAVVSVQPVTGGLVNTNLKLTVAGLRQPILLRLFQRGLLRARIEAAIDRLLGDIVPRARFLHFAETNPVTGDPYAVLQWIDGEQLAAAARTASKPALRELGRCTGAVLAKIHSFHFGRYAFFTADLALSTAIEFDRAGLLTFMQECLREGPGGERLGPELTEQLFAFVEGEGGRLDAWLGTPCLTHADFNPSNILVRRDGGGWHVAAVLDWEFALSATPALDFANLLRPPLGEQAEFIAGLAEGYRAGGGMLPDDWLRIAQIADLFAWSDLLGRRSEDPALAADARRIITATIEGG